MGTFVEVRLQLEEIEDVVRLSRDTVRKGDTVWLKKDGVLEIRPVTIVFRNEDYAFVSEGLQDGEEIVTSQLSRVVAGAELRTEGAEPTADNAATSESQSP
jgi:hypothetical protein